MGLIKSISKIFKSEKETKKDNTTTFYTRSYKKKPYKSNIGNGQCIQFIVCEPKNAMFRITTHDMYVTIERTFDGVKLIETVKQPYSLALRY